MEVCEKFIDSTGCVVSATPFTSAGGKSWDKFASGFYLGRSSECLHEDGL